MGSSGHGNRLERGLFQGRFSKQSSLEEETSWSGAVWAGMVLDNLQSDQYCQVSSVLLLLDVQL